MTDNDLQNDDDMRIVNDMQGKIHMDFEGEVPLLEIVRFVRRAIAEEGVSTALREQENEALIDAFFERIMVAVVNLEPGEGFSLYGPRGVETSPDFSRVTSQFDITIRGQTPAQRLNRLLYIVTKNDDDSAGPKQYLEFIRAAEAVVSRMGSGPIEYIHGPYDITKTQRWADFLRESCVHCDVQQHTNDPAWARFSFRTIF